MRMIAVLILLWTFSVPAAAQQRDCRTIASSTERLACYDRITPPIKADETAAKGKTTSRGDAATTPSPDSQTPLADMLQMENSRLDAKIKNICRGC